MVGKTGLEPATPWSQTMCSTKLSYFPLNTRLRGVEPPCPKTLDPKSSASANSATPACLVSHGGFEPPTLWLKARCSTD